MSTPGVGTEYEINVPAYFALKLNNNKDVKDFSIRSNAANFGNLDDVIIDVSMENGDCLSFALQLKHCEKDKNISPSGFEGKDGSFSLEKYCAGFQEMSPYNRQKYNFIIYTSRYFASSRKKDVKKFTMMEDDQCRGKCLFDTSLDASNTYKFEINNATPNLTSRKEKNGTTIDIRKVEYQEFFSKLTLYTSQKNFQDLEESIMEMLKDRNAVLLYLNLFRKWHQGRFNNKIIDRKIINIQLANIYLSHFMVMDYRLCDSDNQKMSLFEKITKEFNVTVIDETKNKFLKNLANFDFGNLELKSSEKVNVKKYVNQYKMGCISNLVPLMLRLGKELKFIEKEEKELDEDTRNKIFCFCFQNLLIIDFNQHSADAVYNLVNIHQIKEDKTKLILIGRGVDLSKLSSVQVFQNLEDVSKKSSHLYKKIITECTISLQGRKPIILEELVESFNDVNTVFEAKEIVELLKNYHSFGEERLELPSHFIPRKIATTVFDLHSILDYANDNTKIIVVNFDDKFKQTEIELQNKAIHLIEITQYVEKKAIFGHTSIILSTKEPNPEKEITMIRAAESEKSIHVFKMIGEDTFILIRSTSKFSRKNNTKSVFQEEIHTVFDGTLNLLVAEPGMGKSTLMKYLRNEYPSNFWVIYADLKSHSTFFSQLRTTEEALARFITSGPEESNFLKKLKNVYTERKRIVLFLDGLDELPNVCIKNILETIESLSLMGYCVWVSSRQNLEELLSEKFHLFSLGIIELCEEEQKAYIERRLEVLYNKEEISGFVNRIFEGISIVNNTQFLGIPLQLYILTQIFLDETRDYKYITENFFVITKLYRCFFRGRFNHYLQKYKCGRHCPFLPNAEEHLEQYEIAALECILSERSFRKLQLDCRSNRRFLRQIETGKDALGIITKVERGKATFEHQTYAEYFACVWLKSNQEKVKLLKNELFSENYEHLRIMFNTLLAENKPLHLAIVNKNFEEFEKYINYVNSRDEAGRTPLHIACCSGTKCLNTKWNSAVVLEVGWYIIMIEVLFEKQSKFFEKDILFNFDCLDYAYASGSLYPLEVALRKKLTKFRIWRQVIYRYYGMIVFVGYCVQLGYPNLLQEIIKENPRVVNEKIFGKSLLKAAMDACCFNTCKEAIKRYENVVEILIDNGVNVNEDFKGNFGRSALHMACRFGHLNIVKKLLDKKVCITDTKAVLHSACECPTPNEEIINLLINNGFNITTPNNYGTTAFHLACKNRQFDIVQRIFEQEDSIVSNILRSADRHGDNALHYASKSEEDNTKVIILLIDKGMDVNSQNKSGSTPLHKACNCLNIINTIQLLQMGAKLNIVDSQGDTSLAYAMTSLKTKEKLEIIELFVKYGYDMGGKHGTRTLNVAYREGDLVVIETVIRNGAKTDDETLHYASGSPRKNNKVINLLLKDKFFNVNALDSKGKTALNIACEAGIFDNVKTLLEAGADTSCLNLDKHTAFKHFLTSWVYKSELLDLFIEKSSFIDDDPSSLGRIKLLKFASQRGNLESTAKLLARGLSESVADDTKNNTLHYASQLMDDNETIICKLIDAGFDVNTENDNRTTPLQLACQWTNFKNVKTLLQKGAKLKQLDQMGSNVLHYASKAFRDNDKILEFLLNEGLDVNASNKHGETALQLACSYGTMNNIKTLLKHGAKLNHLDQNGENALHYAVTSYQPDRVTMIHFLISSGLDVNSSNINGNTTLHLSCRLDNFKYVPLLLNKGAVVAHVDVNGNNALHYASMSSLNAEKLIDMFIAKGININAKNNSGQTALHLACASSNFENLRKLLHSGAHVNIVDDERRNVLDYAKPDNFNYRYIKGLLIHHGLRYRIDQTDNNFIPHCFS